MTERDAAWTAEDVRELLDHEEGRVRTWALQWLDEHGGGGDAGETDELASELDSELAELAAGMLADPEPRVATAAVDVLRATGPAGHRRALEACFDRDDLSERTLGRLMMLLAAAGAEGAVEAAADGLRDEESGFPRFEWSIWAAHAPEAFADFLLEVFSGRDLPPEPELLDACIRTHDARLAAPVLSAILRMQGGQGGQGARGPEDDQRRQLLEDLLFSAAGTLPAMPDPEDIQWQGDGDSDADGDSDVPRQLPFPADDDIGREFAQRLRQNLEANDATGFAECVADFAETLVDEGLGGEGPDADHNPELAWALGLAEALPATAEALETETPELLVRVAYGVHVGLTQAVGVQQALETREDFEDLLELRALSIGRERDRVAEAIAERWNDAPADSRERERWAEAVREWFVDSLPPDVHLQRLQVVAPLEGLRLDDVLADFVEGFRGPDFDLQALGPQAITAFSRVLLAQRDWFSEHAGALIEAGGGLSDSAQFALGKSNAQWAAEVFRDHMDTILQTDIGGDVWQDVRRLGDPALLELVLEEWHPHQNQLTRTAHLLAHLVDRLAGRPDALPEAVAEEVARLENPAHGRSVLEIFNRFQRGEDVRDIASLPLLLRCRDCQRCYRYEFDRVRLDSQKVRTNPGGVFESADFEPTPECWHCGGTDFSPTRVTEVILFLGLRAVLDRQAPLPEDSVFQLDAPDITHDHRTPGRGRRSLHRRSGRSSSSGKTGSSYRADDEPGRNDPCPCGSGRKYKKCCLRK